MYRLFKLNEFIVTQNFQVNLILTTDKVWIWNSFFIDVLKELSFLNIFLGHFCGNTFGNIFFQFNYPLFSNGFRFGLTRFKNFFSLQFSFKLWIFFLFIWFFSFFFLVTRWIVVFKIVIKQVIRIIVQVLWHILVDCDSLS